MRIHNRNLEWRIIVRRFGSRNATAQFMVAILALKPKRVSRKRDDSASSPSQSDTNGSDDDTYEDTEDIVEENERPIPPTNLRSVNYRINYGKPLQAMQEAIRNNIGRPANQRQPGQNNSNPPK